MIFVLLCLNYFTQYDNLQIYPCCRKWHCFILFYDESSSLVGFAGVTVVKNLPSTAGVLRDVGLISGSGRSPGSPTPVFLPGESHGQRSLEGYSPQGHKESDMTEATQHACMQSIVHMYHIFFSDAVSIKNNSGLCCKESEQE